jgi:signal transduction histidine kinase/CheY-like chemotaxis protein/PAS domain-containing protein
MLHLDDVIDHHFLMIAASTSVEEAIARLQQSPHGQIIVVAADQHPEFVGVLSEREVVQLFVNQRELSQTRVGEVMRALPALHFGEQDLASTLAIFQQQQVSALPVIDEEGIPVGWLFAQQLLQALHTEQLEQEAQTSSWVEPAANRSQTGYRRPVEVALSRSNAALKAQQEAALDGILVVDEYRQIASFNRRFCELWQIPRHWMAQTDSPKLLQKILDQLEQPQEFLNRVEYLYAHPHEISHEEISLKNGRAFERYSAPVQSSEGEYYGRVWFFRDISERKQTERQLEQRQRYLAVLVEIQRYLLASNSTQPGYTTILHRLGQTCGADRVYLFENHHSETNTLLMSQRAEWCGTGISPEIDNPVLQNLSYDDFFPRWTTILSRGESINGIVREFPESERIVLEPQGIQAILILPLMVNHTFWGFIGFDNCTEPRQWTTSEVSLLSVAASAISLYHERQQAEIALRESINRERATLRVIERMRQTLDLNQIFNSTVEELSQLLRCDRTIIYQFHPDWSGQVVAEFCAESWQALTQLQAGEFQFPREICDNDRCQLKNWGTLYPGPVNAQSDPALIKVESRYTCVSNVDTANLSPSYFNFLKQLQTKAYLTVPIYLGNFLWGILVSYQNSHSRNWQVSEINLVMHISTQLGVALQQAELFNQTQKQSTDLEKARDAAETANLAKSEFLTNISHELRTPLNAILGFTQVMSHDVSNPKHREYINIIDRSGQHLLKLINDVLEMSKIEAGRHRLNPSEFDFHHLLDSLYEMLLLKAQIKHLSLTFNVASDVPQYLKTDEGKLRQVLLNLLGNAIKFTSSGQVILRVKRADEERADDLPASTLFLNFEVEDTGLGIAPDEIADLFTPFVQTYAGQQSSEGTGLGLAISQKYVQLMGGTITVDSIPNQGSCFRFKIVATLAEAPAFEPVCPARRVISLEPEQPTYRILIVEDHWESRQLLVELLHPVGFEVQIATNGEEGIHAWRHWQPHLILMDIRMPVMDGYQATQQIRALAQEQCPIIIAITSNAFEEDRVSILSIGCNDFISKPFQEEVIFAKLAEHLGVRYVYENSGNSVIKHTIVASQKHQFIVESLAVMPRTWMVQLHQAAVQGRDTLILELAGHIPMTHTELRQEIESLARSFQFEEIINLISSYFINS